MGCFESRRTRRGPKSAKDEVTADEADSEPGSEEVGSKGGVYGCGKRDGEVSLSHK